MAKNKVKRLDPLSLDILRDSQIDDSGVHLCRELERVEYLAVKSFLEACGYEWNKKQGTHLATTPEAKQSLLLALECGYLVDEKKTYQAFFTPEVIADFMLNQTRLDSGMKVLEPSAGIGNLVQAIDRRAYLSGAKEISLDAFEIYKPFYDRLVSRNVSHVSRFCALRDFLKPDEQGRLIREEYDRIYMNPPFSASQEALHVLHAYKHLKPGGVLLSLLSKAYNFRETKSYKELKALINENGELATQLPEGSFKAVGTDIDIILVKIRKPKK